MNFNLILESEGRAEEVRRIAASTVVIERPEAETPTGTGRAGGYVVTVFNNEHNTYQEVMTILIVATGCTADEAYVETWEIDHLGKSVVHQGSAEECQSVADVISTIGIRVEVSEDR